MRTFNLEVTKKETVGDVTKTVPVGSVAVYYPELSELGFDVQPTGYTKALDKDGKEIVGTQEFPIYDDEKHNYVWSAVWAAVKANARNKLVSGTATLKDGATIADSVEALIEVAERDGTALKNRRDCFAAFKTYMLAQGKAVAFVQQVIDVASSNKTLPLQSAKRKDSLKELIGAFFVSCKPEDASRFDRTVDSIVTACETPDNSDF